jgi:hypothetical protein
MGKVLMLGHGLHVYRGANRPQRVKITYEPIAEYGGWGIRFGNKGMAYDVRGNKGIYITLTSGKHILIGTSKPNETEQFLKKNEYI